jgi:drug/metabolite transporter (DMT)-like permease
MTWRAWTAFAALCVVWGIPYFFIKLAIAEIPPAGVAFGRIALGAMVLLPIAWKRGVLPQTRVRFGAIVAFALVELVGPFFLISLGESWISSSLTGILIATVPLSVVLISPLFGVKERLSGRRALGLALGFIGVVALLGIDPPKSGLQWAGVACILVSVTGYAVGSLIVQRYLHGVDELAAVAVSLGVAALILSPIAALTAPATLPSAHALTAVAVLGIVCTALALLCYVYLIAQAGASRASVITYVNPAVAVLLGVLLLGEHFGVGTVVGFMMIIIGSWLGTQGRKEEATWNTSPAADSFKTQQP